MMWTHSVLATARVASAISIASDVILVAGEPSAIDIGSRRELFVDKFLIAKRDGVDLRLHSPTSREVVLKCDAPWEGSGCGYETIFRDGSVIRMARWSIFPS